MLSKAVDDASDPGATAFKTNLPQNVRNMAAEHAPSSFDHRHRAVGNAIFAFTVNIGTDRANIGAGPAQRPNQICDPNEGGAQTAAQWFNTNCFALQPQFTFGDAPPNTVLSSGYADIDLGTQKDVSFHGRGRLQLRWEIFNLLNPSTSTFPTESRSRRISGTSSARSPRGKCRQESSCYSEHLAHLMRKLLAANRSKSPFVVSAPPSASWHRLSLD
jgi:hypothetical protein